jgi:hypothetical protein
VRYIPPFQCIKGHLEISQAKGDLSRINGANEDVARLIQALLIGLEVDEAWYLRRNEDVALGVQEGKVKSAKQHFLEHGYFEGRAPFQMPVDEIWYLAMYADVAEQVRLGAIASGQAHFDEAGYHEGRLPRAL